MMKKYCVVVLACLAIGAYAAAGEMTWRTNHRVAEYFDVALENHPTLVAFLHKMPKGADLHNHTYGAVYAETLIRMAQEAGLYFDREAKAFVAEKPVGPHYTPAELTESYWKTAEVMQGISLRDLHLADESGHNRFFRSFDRFGAALSSDFPILKEILWRAFNQEIGYIELMTLPDASDDWRNTVEAIRREVVEEFAAKGVRREFEVRYIYSIVRVVGVELFRQQVEQAFATAAAMPDLVVGITILAPEDDWASQSNFAGHMRILDAAMRQARARHAADPAGVPPPPKMMLHGGELTIDIATYESMTDRISRTIEEGHADRIGHGTAIMWENNVYDTLRLMRDRGIAVEFCPSSSEKILQVPGEWHPFPLYWAANVPLVVATDDEGVARSNLTLEFAKAAEWFCLSYGEIKWLAMNSLEYSFLPGESFFVDGDSNQPRADAEAEAARTRKSFMQWDLLKRFDEFERNMVAVLDEFNW